MGLQPKVGAPAPTLGRARKESLNRNAVVANFNHFLKSWAMGCLTETCNSIRVDADSWRGTQGRRALANPGLEDVGIRRMATDGALRFRDFLRTLGGIGQP